MKNNKVTKETWKNISGYEECYMISSKGRVKSLDRTTIGHNGHTYHFKGRVIILKKTIHGYLNVELSINNHRTIWAVHRLVAIAFIPNTLNKCCVNHIDSDRTNNNIENLNWVTHKENIEHAIECGRINGIKKIDIPFAIELYKNGKTIDQISKKYKVGRGAVIRILKANNIVLRTWLQTMLAKNTYNKEEIASLYKLGLSLRRISDIVGEAHNVISNVLRRNNIKTRNNSEAQLIRKEIKYILAMPNEEILKLVQQKGEQ